MYAIRSYYEMDVDHLALHIGQFHVTVVALQHRADFLEDFLDLLDLLHQRQLLGRRGRGCSREHLLGFGRGRHFSTAGRLGHDLGEDFLDAFMACGATATGLGVVGHVLDGLEVVGANRVFDHDGVDGEALAHQRAFFMVVDPFFATIVGDRGLERFTAHDRAVRNNFV